MSDSPDLRLILRNTENAARDSRAALDVTSRFIDAFAPRISTLEARMGGVEQRLTGLERALDELARSNNRIEAMLADILRRLS